MSNTSTNIQLLALDFIENKNNKQFKLLTQRLNPGLLTFAYKFVKDKDLAKEVVEQTFIAIWEKIDQYKTQYNFSTWVYAIAKNEALGILRGKSKTLSYEKYTDNHSKLLQSCIPTYSIDTECMGPTGEDATRTLYDASLSAIEELEEPYRTVMIEREINQKQLNVIANDLQMNLSTVKTRLRKGRKDIADILYKKYPDLVDSYFGNENEN